MKLNMAFVLAMLVSAFAFGVGSSTASAQSAGQCASCETIFNQCFYGCEGDPSCWPACFNQRFLCRQMYCNY